jgi:predicted phage terminase large subunit-like protein
MESLQDLESQLLSYKEALLPIWEAEASLHSFVKQAWHILEPETEFIDGWHIKAICEHLEAITFSKIRNLIINVPPRTCKSTIVSVMWPSWWWIREPYLRFLCASHSYDISGRDSRNCRAVIQSDWYQRNWGDRFSISTKSNNKDTEHLFENDCRGSRKAVSVGSKVAGVGADVLIGDDLNDISEVFSDTIRNKTNRWYGSSFSTRLNNRKTGVKVLMMQRSHEMDVTGYVLSKYPENWIKLILPMEFEPHRRCVTLALPSTANEPWKDPRTKPDELLWPEQDGPKEVADRKKDLGNAYDISGQLQQRPAPDEGGIIRKKSFKWWVKPTPPEMNLIVQSWDTALTASDMEKNSYHACTTWGLFSDDNQRTNLILLGMWRGRCEYPELRTMAKRLYYDWRDDGAVDIVPDGKHTPHRVIVENKAAGSPLMQDLLRMGITAEGFNPVKRYGDKIERVRYVTHIIENGQVWVPAVPPDYKRLRTYAEKHVELCAAFPHADSRDVVDTMTQVMLRLMQGGLLRDKWQEVKKTEKRRFALYGVDE